MAELRRVALALAALVVVSGAWRVAREPLIVLAARYSVGDNERLDLMIVALRARVPGFPSQNRLPLFREDASRPPWRFAATEMRARTWCCWREDERFRLDTSGRIVRREDLRFFDRELRSRGAVRLPYPGPVDLHDVDFDGCVEVSCRFLHVPEDSNPVAVRYDVILTLGEKTNQLRAIVTADCAKGPNYGAAWGIFSAERPADRGEWHLADAHQVQRGMFRLGVTSAPHVRLHWEQPGAAPRVLNNAKPDEIIVWSPPGGSMEIPIDADLRAIAESVVPLPEGFGRRFSPTWQAPTTGQAGDE